MNVKMYRISNGKWALEGDVWGVAQEKNAISVHGFKSDDAVVWKKLGKYVTGKTTALKDNDKVLVQTDADNRIIKNALLTVNKN